MGDRIEMERRARGWSQQRLVDEILAAGGTITQSGLDRLEKRGSNRSAQSSYIAAALGVSHDWLVTGKGQKTDAKSIDRKLRLLPPEDFDDLYDDLAAIVDRRLEKRNIRS